MKKIHFDEKAFDEALKNRKAVVDQVNILSGKFDQENVKLTSEILSNFIQNPIVAPGQTFTEQILFDATLKTIKGKVTSIFRSTLYHEVSNLAREFEEDRKLIHDLGQKTGGDISYLSLANGKASLEESTIEELREQHTAYLRPEDEELYKMAEKFAAELNKVRAFMQGKTIWGEMDFGEQLIYIGGGPVQNKARCLEVENGEITVNPQFFGTRERRIEINKRYNR